MRRREFIAQRMLSGHAGDRRDPACDHALASFMEVLDTTIASVALPYILQPW
jgi:hypothetical protein